MIEIEKNTELEYNELVTLKVIEQDEELCSIFKEDIKLPFSMLYRLSKDGSLNFSIITKRSIGILDLLILTNNSSIDFLFLSISSFVSINVNHHIL
jgi:hypothetical protein